HGGEVAAGEDKVAYGKFVMDESADALVDPLVARAEDQQVRVSGQLTGGLLVEATSGGAHQHDARLGLAQALDGFEHRFALEDHAGSASEGPVIDGAMAVVGPVAQVVDVQLKDPATTCAFDDAFVERTAKHPGEKREHVDSH